MIKLDFQLPVERRASSRGGTQFQSRAALGTLFQDPAVVGIFAVAIGILAFAAYLDVDTTKRQTQVQVRVDSAVRDSTTMALEQSEAHKLRDRRNEVVARLERIKTLDHNRYAFDHVMDQVAALRIEDIYLDSLSTLSENDSTGNVKVRLTGVASSEASVGRYMRNLQRSPFIGTAAFVGSGKKVVNQQDVVSFAIELTSTLPPMSQLSTQTINSDGTLSTPAPYTPRIGTTDLLPTDAASNGGMFVPLGTPGQVGNPNTVAPPTPYPASTTAGSRGSLPAGTPTSPPPRFTPLPSNAIQSHVVRPAVPRKP